ncbi:MAG TPA: FAD-binding oxidoreductase [Propionibacteriaceae bacterium]|nr:FAD-binding oxidoreductase [Propionibacteriaceae bacterium]
MTDSSPLIKVAVLGGGVIGASTAHQLARAGADVILLTEGELTNGASGRSLSWLNAAGIWREPYHRLRMAGIDRYRTLSAQQPGVRWLRFPGGLAWYPQDKDEELRRRHDHEVAHGYDSHMLKPEDVSAHTPGVNAAAIPDTGAIWNPGEGWVDLPSLVQFLIRDFVERGGQLVTRAGKCSLLSKADLVTGLATQAGQHVEADAVVLAAGAAVPGIVADLGITIPDATTIALLVTSRPVHHPQRAVLNTPRVSMRPTPDGALAIDSDWTNAHITRGADGRYQVPEAIIEALLAEASVVLNGRPELETAWYGIGPKPIPGDGEPVLGRVDHVGGLYVAFTHSGATLGLIAGELLAYEIITGAAHQMLVDFNLRRFR